MKKHIDNECLFCKIANGEIPSDTIYEDEDFRVILDISPASDGHAIILPKNHAANLFELEKDDAAKIIGVAQKVGRAMMDSLGCEGLNVLQNNGEAAGQTVFHLHMHLIPRYIKDSVNINWEFGDGKDNKQLAEKIKAAL